MIFEWIKRVLVSAFGKPAPEPEPEAPWVGAARVLGEMLAAIEAHDAHEAHEAHEASKQADGKEAA